MLQSMTGFGKASASLNNKKITVEIRSLNSKNLDLNMRMPSFYREIELNLRKTIGKHLDRGKVDCNVSYDQNGSEKNYTINQDLATNYYNQLNDLADSLNQPKEDLLQMVMRMPEIYSSAQEDLSSEEKEFISKLVSEAIENLIAFRAKEGQQLHEEFTQRINTIQSLLNEVPAFEEERIPVIKERISKNLEEVINKDNIDSNRFEQELIYYIEKFDISEEKMRLQNHLNYFLETLNLDKSSGKKLGFITQEIGREINTLGSKSYHTELQKIVVQMKDELEKIKEQVLNTL